jgi:hypothetical protein
VVHRGGGITNGGSSNIAQWQRSGRKECHDGRFSCGKEVKGNNIIQTYLDKRACLPKQSSDVACLMTGEKKIGRFEVEKFRGEFT